MTVDLIVNPASGPARRGQPRSSRLRLVSESLRALGATIARATETSAIGDAARGAIAARDAGSDLVIVWGGDGTINEAAGVLLGTGMRLGIVPGGSGNGLARGLGLPFDVGAAVRVALEGRARDIDTGSVDGRAFLNLAGVGFDASVADRVNTCNPHRGLRPYVEAIAREFRTFETQRFRLTLDDTPPMDVDAHLVVVCNGQQYGHGARIAPDASFDDGLLDVVAVPDITVLRLVRHGWRLFNGTMGSIPGVLTARARRIVVSHDRPLPVHLDGEVVRDGTARVFEVHPRSLRVMVSR